MTETSLRVADRIPGGAPGGAELARRQSAAVADVPALEPTEGGPAQRFAQALSGRHPVTVFLVASILGYLLLAALTIALGLLLTEVVLRSGGVASADERFVGWLAAHRDPTRTEASLIGSIIAGGVVIPIVVGVVAVVLACFKRWRIAAFLIAAIAVEAATYRATTWVVHRDRPHVHRLEDLPANASFPSGHTAASIAVYCGLALVLTSRVRSTWFAAVCWTIALRDTAFRGAGPHVPRDAPSARHPRRGRDRHRRAARRALRRPRRRLRRPRARRADRMRSAT